MPRTGDISCSVVAVAFLAAVLALVATAVHAQCGYQPQQYGVYQPMLDVVWQPTPELTIGFSTGPIYAPPCDLQPYFIPAPPPVFYGGPQFGYGGGWDNNPAFQQGYDSRWRQHAREQQDALDAAARAAGRRVADRAWGIGPAYGRRY